jgi:RNA polymerase sigma-54 factor
VCQYAARFYLAWRKISKPVTRAQISVELEVHESTISRAVANKAVQLPNKKIIPLASFFDRSLNVRSVLKDIIEHEAAPLSDSELVDLLSERGYEVARRTVAKYRSIEGILPAHLKKQLPNAHEIISCSNRDYIAEAEPNPRVCRNLCGCKSG